jgi:L-cysteate sulfo-lyase
MPSVLSARNILSRFPQEGFTITPTPLHRLPRLSASLGLELWCKRDDLTGPALGGNKTRKLDFLVSEALAQGADTIVAVGAVQSNFCRLAAAAAAQRGLTAHLVLGETPTEKATLETPRGNLALDLLLGATVHVVSDNTDHQAWEQAADGLACTLQAEGRRVYKMPLGGSTPLGALGYAAALLEIVAQAETAGLEVGTIVHASGSGGTQAGLIAGKLLCGWPGRIVGMSVSDDAEALAARVLDLTAGALALTPQEAGEGRVLPSHVLVDAAYRGPDYSVPTPEAMEAISLFAREEGLILDRVYTGKAAAGLLDYARMGRLETGKAAVFLHTGGSVEILA